MSGGTQEPPKTGRWSDDPRSTVALIKNIEEMLDIIKYRENSRSADSGGTQEPPK
jgi:hypothetical protein